MMSNTAKKSFDSNNQSFYRYHFDRIKLLLFSFWFLDSLEIILSV